MASWHKFGWYGLRRGWFCHVLPPFSVAASLLRSPDQLIDQPTAPAPELGRKVAIFVHFDPAGAVRDDVLLYLGALRDAGYAIAFVTNSGQLRTEARAALAPLCSVIMVRRNVGYDFGAMRECILGLGLPRPDTEHLLIANDSVYGPLRSLAETLARLDFGAADVWGCTESWQQRYHLQSYLLAFGPRALRHPVWRGFWTGVRPVQSKEWIIRRYEIGFTQVLLRAGLTCRALWPYADLVQAVDPHLLAMTDQEASRSGDPIMVMRKNHARHIRNCAVLRKPLNPTSDLWRQLLLAGFPFLKRELLRKNPTNVNDVTDWRDVVHLQLGLDPTLIERDLQSAARNVAP